MCVAFYSRKSIENLIAGGMSFKDWSVISFYDVGDDENRVDYSGVCSRVMYIAIDDIDREELYDSGGSFDAFFPEANLAAEFIIDSYNSGLDIICQCEYGQGRSAGCSAAILEHYYHNGISVFSDYGCYPNLLIYHKILNALNHRKERVELHLHTNMSAEGVSSAEELILQTAEYGQTGVYGYRRSAPADTYGRRNNHANRSENDIIRIENGVPQIISREMFDAVQGVMNKRKLAPYTRSDAKEVYLLSGKVFCGLCGNSYCGNRMHGGRNKSLYITYRCNSHSGKGTGNCRNKVVNRDYLENYIRKLLAEVLFDERRLEGVINEYNKLVHSNEGESASELKSLKSTIKRTRKEIDNIVGIIASTGSASLTAALYEREKRLAMLQEKKREIEARQVTIETNRDDIIEAFRRGREMLLSGTIPHLRQLIQLYVSRIDVYPDHITATLNYMPALMAAGSDESIGKYAEVYEGALEVRDKVGREELNENFR